MARTALQAYDDLMRRTREASVLASCGSLLSWDESTYMPRQGSAHRGAQMGLLARLLMVPHEGPARVFP
jgi:carboxypeptidase Taq